MFPILQKVDKGLELKVKCTLIDKMGHYYHGIFEDSWARVSGGKLRGKVVFQSEEKGRLEVDVNDILDVLLPDSQTADQGAKK